MAEMPRYGLDDEQVEFLEARFAELTTLYDGRIGQTTRMQRSMVAMQINAESQLVGRWWAARERLEAGIVKPSSRKSPEQVAMLDEVFFYGEEMHSVAEVGAKGPFPDEEGCQDLAARTGLSYKQVKSWLENQRKKATESGRLELWFDSDTKWTRPTHYRFNW